MSPLFPTADTRATDSTETAEDLSSRHLEEVGPTAVLGAMVEQRRRSSSVPPPNEDDSDAVATQRRERIAPSDDVFQKIR